MAEWGNWVNNASGNGMRLGFDQWWDGAVKGVYVRRYAEFKGSVTDSNNTYQANGSHPHAATALSIKHTGAKTYELDTTFHYRPQSYGSAYSGSWSASLTGIDAIPGTCTTSASWYVEPIPYERPNAPVNPTVVWESDTRLRVNWGNNYTGTDGARPWTNVAIDRRVNGGSWARVANVTPGVTDWWDTDVAANSKYEYVLYGQNSVGYSDPAVAPVMRTSPAAPSSVSCSVSGQNLLIGWYDNALVEDTFDIYLEQTSVVDGSVSGEWILGIPGDNAPTGSKSYSMPMPSERSKIRVKMRAWNNQAGFSSESPWSPYLNLAVPTIGTSYAASGHTRNSFIIGNLSVLNTGGVAPNRARFQVNTSASATGATTYTSDSWAPFTVSGLVAETKYFYRVSAGNAVGWSAWGSWKNTTTLSDAPDDIGTITFDEIEEDSLTIMWLAPNMNGATFQHYYWEISKRADFATIVKSGTTTNTSMQVSGLLAGTKYYARARANALPNNGGYGVGSATTLGIRINGGLRIYTFVGGVRRKLGLYTFVSGQRIKLRPMTMINGTWERE